MKSMARKVNPVFLTVLVFAGILLLAIVGPQLIPNHTSFPINQPAAQVQIQPDAPAAQVQPSANTRFLDTLSKEATVAGVTVSAETIGSGNCGFHIRGEAILGDPHDGWDDEGPCTKAAFGAFISAFTEMIQRELRDLGWTQARIDATINALSGAARIVSAWFSK